MKTATLENAYAAFIDMHGKAMPVRTCEEFRDVLSAAALVDPVGLPHITEAHLRALFDCMWAWDCDVPAALASARLRRVTDP